jgi:RNA-directed DNA polymerase
LAKPNRLLTLLDHIIDHPIPGGALGKGLPIGNLTSQYFANLYLGELDHFLKERLRIKGYVRYMDDFLVLAHEKACLHTTLATIRSFLHDVLQLDLKDEVVRIAPVTQGIPFLGFRIFPGLIRLEGKKWARFRRQVRVLEAQYACAMIDEATLARSVASMIGHVIHADSLAARRAFFAGSFSLG